MDQQGAVSSLGFFSQSVFHAESFQSSFWASAFGALVGAGAAFILERTHAGHAERKRKVSLGNQAIYKLGLMYSILTSLEDTLFADYRKEHDGKAPEWWEVVGHNDVTASGLSFNLSDLAFLAETYDPDVLNRLLMAERVFLTALDLANRRSALQIELQAAVRGAGVRPQTEMTVGALREVGGYDRTTQIEHLHRSLLADLPRERKMLLEVCEELHQVLKYSFPLSRIIGYTTKSDDLSGYRKSNKPALWRRIVRQARQLVLAPIKTVKQWWANLR